MNVIESLNVDLIEPFPIDEVGRVYTWLFCYASVVETDLSPKGEKAWIEMMKQQLPACRSFGVIDKHDRLGLKHEASLIGMISLEPAGPWNRYIHVASNRRAWGSGFMDEAIGAAMSYTFDAEPALLRISAAVLRANAPVNALAKRIGARFEGIMHDMVTQNGVPKPLVHWGMTRYRWKSLLENAKIGEELQPTVEAQES